MTTPSPIPSPPSKTKGKTKGTKNSSGESTLTSLVVLAGILAALGLIPIFWLSGFGVFAFLETLVRAWGHVILLVVVPVILACVWIDKKSALDKNLRPSERKTNPRSRLFGRLTALASLVAVLGVAYAIFMHPYLVAKAFTASAVTAEETTNFADRAPWIVANNYAQRDQGDIIGDRESVHYVPAAKDAEAEAGDGAGVGTSRYTVLVKERGMLGTGGYEAIQTLTMPTTGAIPASASSYCEVPETMGSRLDTVWPWHSLAWSIHFQQPFAHWEQEDAYGYCDANGEPTIVIPLWKYEGGWNSTKAPNGAAIYTAEGVKILGPDQLASEGIEGPTYPRSLAATQRESINAGGSLADWWGSRYGYDLTNEDDEDSNDQNPSEFTLVTAGSGDLTYVTPLTPRGSSQSITATSQVPATQTGASLSPLTINNVTDLPATSTLTTAIKESSVAGDNAWTTRWASGMGVYEILPAQDGHWVASIGQGQAVSYRADISPDGSVTVVNAETGTSSDTNGEDSVTVDTGKPLSSMTDSEILELIRQGTEELQRRESENQQ